MASDDILEVKDLKVWFPLKKGVFSRTTGHVKAVDGISFALRRGETLGVVGESGCGKSTMSRAILGLVKPNGGEILFNGRSLGTMSRREVAQKIQVVFQDPLASLNPRHTVVEVLTEGMIYHGLCKKSQARDRGAQLLERVGLGADALDRYPHEFSGGQRQRICIARAIALEPELLICDEAVSALDLSIRAQMLDLLRGLKEKLGLSVMFISHDIGVVQHISDRMIVMYRGKIVERGTCDEVIGNPTEAYTKSLIDSVPRIRGLERP